MPITSGQIRWVAGILEGEGTFCLNNNSPRLAVAMTDLDVVEKFGQIVDPTKRISPHSEGKSKDGYVRKTRYTFTLMGNLAIQWMMTIYSLMGLRRKQEIRKLIFHWKMACHSRQGTRKRGAANLQGFAYRFRKQGYSDTEIEMAKIFLASGFTEEQILEKLEAYKTSESIN